MNSRVWSFGVMFNEQRNKAALWGGNTGDWLGLVAACFDWGAFRQSFRVKTSFSNLTRSSGKNCWPTFLWYDTDRIWNDAPSNSSIVSDGARNQKQLCWRGPTAIYWTWTWNFYRCVSIRCRGNVFAELLFSSERGDTHTGTQTARSFCNFFNFLKREDRIRGTGVFNILENLV
jgi:hypothetical protein